MSWKPILVGVDASPSATIAAALGWRLAKMAHTSCHFIHAAPDPTVAVAAVGAAQLLQEIERATIALAQRRVSAALLQYVPAAALENLTVRIGRPAFVIKAEAERLGAELVVLGGKRHSALGRWVGGSTVIDTVRTLGRPVLVTKGAGGDLQRVLAAVDLSSAAKPAIEAAARFARLWKGSVKAVHVMEPLPIVPDMPLLLSPKEVYAHLDAALKRSVWPIVHRYGAEPVVRHGTAAEVLAREAARWKADLLVVATHGKGFVDRLLLGSVTERVLHHLPTSVLVVPATGVRRAGTKPARIRPARGRVPASAVA